MINRSSEGLSWNHAVIDRMKRTFHALTVSAALTVFGQQALAQDFEKGIEAYDSGDYATALEEFKPLAEQGDSKGQFYLGKMYDKGEGVPQDDAEAVKWYRLAAEQGDAYGQYQLGLRYYNGQGVIEDYLYAHMWSNIAASLGEKRALKSRNEIAALMTREDISKAQVLARECVAKDYKGC